MSRHRHPLESRLRDAILSLQPTAYWPLDDGSGPLRSLTGGWSATVTGSPTFGVAAPSPIGRGVTWSGTGQYATTSTSVPTPTTAMSVVCLYNPAVTGTQWLMTRYLDSSSWGLASGSDGSLGFSLFRDGGLAHGQAWTAVISGSRWRLAAGTFDGTTIRTYQGTETGVITTSSTSLTGTWNNASTAPINLACLQAGAQEYAGTEAHPAYWSGRALSAADIALLASIAFGG